MKEQQHTEGSLTVLSTNTMFFHNEQKRHIMRFETDPIEEFRARMYADYTPKKEIKRDGTKSTPRKTSYFADLNNRHYLNLLVCYFDEKYLIEYVF